MGKDVEPVNGRSAIILGDDRAIAEIIHRCNFDNFGNISLS